MSSGDGECTESANGQGEDKNIIDKILGEMKSEFNKTEKIEKDTMDTSLSNSVAEENVKTEESTNVEVQNQNSVEEEEVDKPRIILSFKKPNCESPVKNKEVGRRSLRQKSGVEEKVEETGLKRSARRRSKDCNESVLQSAIARKEKSYNESSKPQRLTRQLKPTQKILENLALAKQEKTKTDKTKTRVRNNDSDSLTESDSFKNEEDRIHRKRKHKHHHNKHSKKAKKSKSDSSRDSDSDQSSHEETVMQNIFQSKQEEGGFRRSRRISSSRNKEDSNTDGDEQSLQDSIVNDENVFSKDGKEVEDEAVKTRLCLCTEKTQYYLATNDEETTYCAAVDNIGDKIIGCSRAVDPKEVMLMRPSPRVPYTILCAAHKNRLLRHNCCPTCGIFCTQGRFVECEAKHHYHRDCQISVGGTDCCPHCGTATPSYEVNITMHAAKRPIFVPVQKAE